MLAGKHVCTVLASIFCIVLLGISTLRRTRAGIVVVVTVGRVGGNMNDATEKSAEGCGNDF